MPLVLTDTASVVVNDHLVRKPLRERVVVTEISTPERLIVEETESTLRSQVVHVRPKKVKSSYREDLLTSQK